MFAMDMNSRKENTIPSTKNCKEISCIIRFQLQNFGISLQFPIYYRKSFKYIFHIDVYIIKVE